MFVGGDEGARTLDPRLANEPKWFRVGSLSVQDMPSDLHKGRRAFLCGSTLIWPVVARSDDRMLTTDDLWNTIVGRNGPIDIFIARETRYPSWHWLRALRPGPELVEEWDLLVFVDARVLRQHLPAVFRTGALIQLPVGVMDCQLADSCSGLEHDRNGRLIGKLKSNATRKAGVDDDRGRDD